MERYDAVVIGGGSAGITAATFAARLGVSVALIERDRVGGDCTWSGCVPSKALLHIAERISAARSASASSEPDIDAGAGFRRAMDHVRAAIGRVYQYETPTALAASGVTVVRGRARFLDEYTLDVESRRLRGRRILICTGAAPVIPPIPGLESAPFVTYETVWNLEDLPRRLVVLGGSATGVEIAQAFQRLGSRVTIIEQEPRLLPFADAEASTIAERVLQREGVELCTGRRALAIDRTVDRLRVSLADGEVLGDCLFVAAGRRPRVQALNLNRAGVAYGKRGIGVDTHLRTSRRHIYAAGDVAGSFQFTHYAAWQGFIAARNALLPGSSRGVRGTVPWVVFTSPEIGQAGLTEPQARARDATVRVYRWPLERIDRAQTANEHDGFLKLIARRDGRLLGATVVASVAGELVNELELAITRGLTLGDLAATIHAYPTYSTGIQQAAAEASMAGLTKGWKGMALRALARRRL